MGMTLIWVDVNTLRRWGHYFTLLPPPEEQLIFPTFPPQFVYLAVTVLKCFRYVLS